MDGDDRAVAHRTVPAIGGKFGNVGEESSHQAPGTTVFETNIVDIRLSTNPVMTNNL